MRRVSDVIGRLYAVYHEANERHFAGLLPALYIHVEMAGSRRAGLRILAYLWTDETCAPRYIVVDGRHALIDPWPTVRETMLHEMIHVWQAVAGRKVAHDAAFRRMARRLGISERAVD